MWPRKSLTSLSAFASLHHRNYRRFFVAQLISTIGIWVHLIAENWLVVELSGRSGLALGITAALQFAPSLLFGLHAGVLVDRSNRRRLLIGTQGAAGLVALALWMLTATDLIELWMIWAAAFVSGSITSVDVTVRQAFTNELVGRDDVANAVALNNGVATAARMLGPAGAGLLIATTDISLAFLVNGLTFIVVILVLVTMDTAKLFSGERMAARAGQVREGLAYVRDHAILRPVVVMMFLVFTFAYNFQVLMPILASDSLGGDSRLYGYLMSAMGAGSLVGSLVAATRTWTGRQAAVVMSLILALAQTAVALAPEALTAAAGAAFMGIASSVFLIIISSTLQQESRDETRGRVMSLYSIAFLGTGAIGGPVVGGIADAVGARVAFLAAALSCLGAAALGHGFFAELHTKVSTSTPSQTTGETIRLAQGLPSRNEPGNLLDSAGKPPRK